MSQAQPVGGRFEIGELVHAGKTGEVFKARDQQTDQTVAVKRVHASVFDSKLAQQRAERELTQLATLSSDGVAKILAQGVDGDLLWYAMEWAEGRPLSTLVTELGPLPASNAAQLIQVIGKALGDAATVGVIHRDLAAKNVLVAQDGSVKLINFCIPMPGKVPGVPEFVAPEQVAGRPVDLRSNIYSVGAILYLLLTGKPPHAGDGNIAKPSAVTSDIAGAVDEVVLRALETDPSKRFMTVPQLLSALDQAVKAKPEPAATPAPETPAPAAETPAPAAAATAPASASSTQPMGKAGPGNVGKATGKGKAPAPARTLLGMPAIKANQPVAAGKPDTIEEGPKTEPMAAQPEPMADEPAPTEPESDDKPAIGGSIEEKKVSPNKTLLAGKVPSPSMLKTTAPDTPMAKAKAEQAVVAPTPTPTPTPTTPAPEPQPAAKHEPQSMPALTAPSDATAPAKALQSQGSSQAKEPGPAAPVAASTEPHGKEQPSLRAAKKTTGKSTGKNKSVGSSSSSSKKGKKGKFRETLWFKKGDLDAAAAAAAAQKAQQTGDALAADKADSLPMEERYEDDGSVSQADRQQHSLRTGNTEMMQAITADDVRRSMEVDGGVTEEDLIADMQAGRQKIIIAVVIGLLVVIGVIAFLAT